MKLRKNFSSKNHNLGMENSKQQSLTIPNETYTIRELIKKHVRDQMPQSVIRKAQWGLDPKHEDLDLQKTHQMDIVDKNEIIQQNQEIISFQKEHINNKKEEQEIKKQNKKVEESQNKKPKQELSNENAVKVQETLE